MTKKPVKTKEKIQKKSSTDGGDEGLWDHVAAGVKPLGGNLKNRAPDVEILPISQKSHEKKTKTRKSAPARTGESPSPSSLPELSHGAQTGLDKSNAKNLKKGKHAIEGRMDLHGMTQDQAHRALNSFMEGSYGAGKRCVLVITGKGLKPDGSVGVLRLAVPRWLNEEPNRSRVLAFSYATPKDGGEGALYVMLKRKR